MGLCGAHHLTHPPLVGCVQEIGFCHMRIGNGVNSRLQLSGLIAKMCKIKIK